MSRTYRRKSYTPSWVNKYPGERYNCQVWKYHGDFSDYGRRYTKNWKEQADRKRRQDDREQVNNMMKSNDIEYFDFINYEKKYTGFAWNWD